MAEYSILKADSEIDDTTIMSATPKSGTMADSGHEFAPFKSSEMVVSFNKSKLIYLKNDQLWAHFSVFVSQYEMKNEDVVGIIPISKNDFLISKKISECEKDSEIENLDDINLIDDEIVGKKTFFLSSDLPLSEGSKLYFQFCYKDHTGNILGKSTPFQIKESNDMTDSTMPLLTESAINNEPVSDRQDEDDFIVVRSQESFLKERIEHLTKSNSLLQFLIRTMEKDLSVKNDEAKHLQKQLDECNEKLASFNKLKEDSLQQMEFISQQNTSLTDAKKALEDFLHKEKESRKKLEKELSEIRAFCQDYETNYKEAKENESRLQTILMQKEEEITLLQNSNNNLRRQNEEFIDKCSKLEDELGDARFRLATALNERRELMLEKASWELSLKSFDDSKSYLKHRVEELESTKEKQAKEIQTLENELKHSIENLKSLNSKYETEQLLATKKHQEWTLKTDKLNSDYIEMRARLEQAKIEYGKLYFKYHALQKKLQRKQSIESASSSKVVAETDDIDQALRKLELEDLQEREPIPSGMNDRNPVPTVPPLDISFQGQSESIQEPECLQTAVKSLATSPLKTEPTTIEIPCTMCEEVIQCHQHDDDDGTGEVGEMIEHFEKVHLQKMCPVCSVLFDTRLPIFESYFSSHIQNHFNQMKYPK